MSNYVLVPREAITAPMREAMIPFCNPALEYASRDAWDAAIAARPSHCDDLLKKMEECAPALSDALDTLEDRCVIKDGGGYIECVVCCVQWHETMKGHQDDCPIRIGRDAISHLSEAKEKAKAP